MGKTEEVEDPTGWLRFTEFLQNPELRDVALATALSGFVMYRAATMKGFIGKVAGVVAARMEGKSIIDWIATSIKEDKKYQAAYIRYKVLLRKWEYWQRANEEIQEDPPEPFMSFSMYLASLGYSMAMEFPPSVNEDYVRERDHRRALIERWREIRSHKDDEEPLEPPVPVGFEYLEPPTPEQVAIYGVAAFYIGLHPELVPETLKGIGEILKGIGEIIPF